MKVATEKRKERSELRGYLRKNILAEWTVIAKTLQQKHLSLGASRSVVPGVAALASIVTLLEVQIH